VLYVVAAVFTALAGLSSAGIVTAVAVIGTPSLENLLLMPAGEVERQLVLEYAATRHYGARTVAVMVTVLRDAVLALVVGFAVFACGHVWASAGPAPAQAPSRAPASHTAVHHGSCAQVCVSPGDAAR
jgi:hypothetical protein